MSNSTIWENAYTSDGATVKYIDASDMCKFNKMENENICIIKKHIEEVTPLLKNGKANICEEIIAIHEMILALANMIDNPQN